MRPGNPSILITAEIDDAALQPLAAKGFEIDVIAFIQTQSLQTVQLQQTIEQISTLPATVVFTSSNAVEAVHHLIPNKKLNWKIYCVGKVTGALIQKSLPGVAVKAVADNAATLAQAIIAGKETIHEVYFFCGDKRRNELPLLLTQNNITITEVEVYTTTILPHTISKQYDAILFFSPSAVEGFFKRNSINAATVLFAIGSTTADAIRKYSNNNIVVSEKPSKQYLIEKLVEFFAGRI